MTPEEKERKAFIDKEYKRIKNEDAAKRKAVYEKKKKAKQKPRMSKAQAAAKVTKRYNDTVWPGWRTKDGKRHGVKTYSIEELHKQEQAEAVKKKGSASTPKKKPRENEKPC